MEVISIMSIKVYVLVFKNKTIPTSLCSKGLDSFGAV